MIFSRILRHKQSAKTHPHDLHRGSYMSGHVVLNSNKLGKSEKMQGLSSILSLFCKEFNKFNNTGV